MSNFRQCKLLLLILCSFLVLFITSSAKAYDFGKNIVIISYDVSGTMAKKYVPDAVHQRVQDYLKYILGIENGGRNIENSTGWKGTYLKNLNDKEIVSLPADHWLTRKGLLASGSGCIFVSFGDRINELAAYELDSNKNGINLHYPKAFKDQNTIFEDLLNAVSKIANESAKEKANCYWVAVTDNVEDTNGVGGGHSNEAFTKFCSERYYKPVLSLKLDIPQKENKNKNWQVYINVSHIADLSIAIKDYSDTYTSLEHEINALGQNKLISGSNDYIDCSYKLKDLKLNCDILNRSPNDINTADKIENCISELREKIKGIRMLLNKNEAYGDKIQSLKDEFVKFRNEYGNSDRLDSIEKDLIRVDENLSKMESAEISNSLSNVEKNLNELKRTTKISADSDKQKKELIEREKSALEPIKNKYSNIDQRNKSLGQLATKTAELEAIGTILKQLENTIPNKDENDFNNTLANQNKKLDEIEPLIGYASKPEQYKRLQEFEGKIANLLGRQDVRIEDKENIKNKFNQIKEKFNSLSTDELDKQLRTLDYEILSQGSGSNAGIVLLSFVIFVVVVFLFINSRNKPFNILIESRKNDSDDWDNPVTFYVTTKKGNNKISFTDEGSGLTYPFIISEAFIERKGSTLYLVKGASSRPIHFEETNNLTDSDYQFIVKQAGVNTKSSPKINNTSSSSSSNTDGFEF